MSSAGSNARLVSDSRETSYDAWRLNTVNLFQGIIGAAYGLIEVDRIVASAGRLREPTTTAERVHINGVVFESIRRKLETLSPVQTERVVAVVDEMSKLPHADIRKVVEDLRGLMLLGGTTKAEAIRDSIDQHYAIRLTASALAAAVGLHVDDAESEFRRRFGMSIHDYLMRRRAVEGLALLRAGDKVESVARSVGFHEGKRHFHAAFKLTGTTPGALRKRERVRRRP